MPAKVVTYEDFLGRLHGLFRLVPTESTEIPGQAVTMVDPFDETILADHRADYDEFHSTECLVNRVCIDNALKHGKPFIDSVLIHNISCALCRNYIGGARQTN